MLLTASLSSRGLGHRVFIPATRVRIPVGMPFFLSFFPFPETDIPDCNKPHTRAVWLMAAWEVLRSIGKYWEGLGENIAAFTVSNTV